MVKLYDILKKKLKKIALHSIHKLLIPLSILLLVSPSGIKIILDSHDYHSGIINALIIILSITLAFHFER